MAIQFSVSDCDVPMQVPKLFKGLGYPQAVKKSSITTVSAPHVWPNICAALVWLIDYVRVCQLE